mgnify:CR=1 FL=1
MMRKFDFYEHHTFQLSHDASRPPPRKPPAPVANQRRPPRAARAAPRSPRARAARRPTIKGVNFGKNTNLLAQ